MKGHGNHSRQYVVARERGSNAPLSRLIKEDELKSYFDLLPVDSFISYKGQTLMVRAVWGGGVVCKNSEGEREIIEGPGALTLIKKIKTS